MKLCAVHVNNSKMAFTLKNLQSKYNKGFLLWYCFLFSFLFCLLKKVLKHLQSRTLTRRNKPLFCASCDHHETAMQKAKKSGNEVF